jgi:hypothetical protein
MRGEFALLAHPFVYASNIQIPSVPTRPYEDGQLIRVTAGLEGTISLGPCQSTPKHPAHGGLGSVPRSRLASH